MRAKRSKQYRKLMQHYALTFNFHEPYQVLLDAEIIQAAANFKMHLGQMLTSTLHGQIKPMITQCCIRHLYTLPTTSPAEVAAKDAMITTAKGAERRRCGHRELEQPLSALECLRTVVDPKGSGTNRNRYVVASQEREVREALRGVAGVPLIYINRSVMILEPMAGATAEAREREEREKLRAGLKGARGGTGSAIGEKRKREENAPGEAVMKKRKVKGPKEPNPLSVKKKKPKEPNPSVARQVEDERAAVRKQQKKDPQAGEKSFDAELAAGVEAVDGEQDDVKKKRKRKRMRHPKDETEAGEATDD